ncbi:phospholipid N-methyltransferase [Methylobacterium sp. 4-46]|nr:phospholipid N-methyltransferase [Methylobacterium sp. 4-46]
MPRRSSAKAVALPRSAPRRDLFEDEARFLRSWLERPLVTGAVTPSGRLLARTMASYVDPRRPGPVIELGPGTGPVTDALVRRGIEQERLVLVEYNPDFCDLLRRRFPRATILRGDAYRMRETLGDVLAEPACATISSLPLFTKPLEQRLDLLQEAHDLMHPDAPFVQFTYAVVPPIPAQAFGYTASRSNKVWLNLPPARVWVYRRS